MLKHIILGLILAGGLNLAGCATSADKVDGKADTQVADDDSAEYCQTDSNTGSRLSHTTTCSNDADPAGGASQSVRAIQHTPNIGPSGH